MSVFQDLYDSEINFSVSTFWDGGFEVKLGDEMNGFVAEATLTHYGQVSPWLINAAVMMFPGSKFAFMYRDNLSKYRAAERVSDNAYEAEGPCVEPLASQDGPTEQAV